MLEQLENEFIDIEIEIYKSQDMYYFLIDRVNRLRLKYPYFTMIINRRALQISKDLDLVGPFFDDLEDIILEEDETLRKEREARAKKRREKQEYINYLKDKKKIGDDI